MVEEEHDPQENDVFFDVQINRRPSAKWDPIVADCLHNYRSALDHVVWVLAERYGTANSGRAFPIYLKRAEYRSKVKRDLGNTERCGAKTIIERFQPYKAGNRGDHNALYFLHQLDRFGKHRRLGELIARFLPYDLDISGPPEAPDVLFDHHIDWWDPDDRDAMTVHIHVVSHPVAEVQVDFAPVVGVGLLQPHLQHPGPIPLLPTLDRIRATVRDALRQLEPICEKP